MKTFKLILLLIVLAIGTLSAESVQIKVEDLTQDQLYQIQQQKKNTSDITTVETASKYIGLGKEIGVAINEGLNSTIDAANKFGNTRVGTFTMNILGWKLLGKDLTRVGLSILLLLISIYVLIFNLRQHGNRKINVKGAWYQFWVTKEYKVVGSDRDSDAEPWYRLMFVAVFLVSVWIAFAILP